MAEEKLRDMVTKDVKEYVGMRVDEAKLATVEGLSKFAGKTVALVICLFLVNLALVLFSGVFLYLLNMLLHSWVWSAVLLGFVYLIIGVVLFMKPGFFVNKMVRMFAPMFFCPKDDEEDDDDE